MAQTAPDVSALAQYGPGGALAAVVIVASWYLLRIERARGDRLEAANAELNKAIREQIVPSTTEAVSKATSAVNEVLAALRKREGS